MSWLLDTDVICQPAKRLGDTRVTAWLEQEQARCYTSAVVIAQLACWVRTKEGRQRQALQAWLTRLVDAMHGRIHGSKTATLRPPPDATGSRSRPGTTRTSGVPG